MTRWSLPLVAVAALAGCSHDTSAAAPRPDMAVAAKPDLSFTPQQTLDGGTACLQSQGCMTTTVGPSFPLQSDSNPQPNENDDGVVHGTNGGVSLSQTHTAFQWLWIANTDDWNAGTVTRLDSKSVKETARYPSVTCFSNPEGSRAACDGKSGCCARDDYPSFLRRQAGGASGPRQAVQTTTNNPSRTAVDWNGDVFVGNRAFGGQSSVTKIAANLSDCIDRNHDGKIETSSDINGDGVIDTDCNLDGVPDDIADVKAHACKNGMAQEYYGLDDECVLWTTNTNVPDQWGRPIALGRGDVDSGPSDAWAGTYKDGNFFRIDGTSGQIKLQASVPGHPYGAVIDGSSILWAARVEDPWGLAWLDTTNPSASGAARNPSNLDTRSYGIAIDRDQNVWTGGWGTGQANRYTPDRSSGTTKLGQGFWTVVKNPGGNAGTKGNGRGVAADARTPSSYFIWMARDDGYIVEVPGSTIAKPTTTDLVVDGSAFPAMRVAGSNTIGAGIDADQNVWGVSLTGSVATRIKIDEKGNMITPQIAGGPEEQGCPLQGGDRCTLALYGHSPLEPAPYTYSDFTGFGLRNFTNPKGRWDYITRGCDGSPTLWKQLTWVATTPPGTQVSARWRSGTTPAPDGSWGAWSSSVTVTPADLSKLAPQGQYFEVEFDLSTSDMASTPTLQSFSVQYECNPQIG